MSCPCNIKQTIHQTRTQSDLQQIEFYDNRKGYSLAPNRESTTVNRECGKARFPFNGLNERTQADIDMSIFYDSPERSYKIGPDRKFPESCKPDQCEMNRNRRTAEDIRFNNSYCTEDEDSRAR